MMNNPNMVKIIATKNGKPIVSNGYTTIGDSIAIKTEFLMNKLLSDKNDNKQQVSSFPVLPTVSNNMYNKSQILYTQLQQNPVNTYKQTQPITTDNSITCNTDINSLKSFNSVSSKPNYKNDINMEGTKIKISDILNKLIGIIAYRIEDSKYQEKDGRRSKYVIIQIIYNNEYRVVITGSKYVMKALESVPKDSFPFKAKIIKDNQRYLIVDP